MKIEDEIKQSVEFSSEYHKLAVNILFTASWINSSHISGLKKYGITPQQFNILRILRGQHPKPASVNLLIDRMLDKSSNASRLVDRLAQKGLVEKCTNKTDKRAVDVIINEKGLNLLAQIDSDPIMLESNLSTLTEPEAKKLNDLLDKLRNS